MNRRGNVLDALMTYCRRGSNEEGEFSYYLNQLGKEKEVEKNVDLSNAENLIKLLEEANPNTTINLKPGNYHLPTRHRTVIISQWGLNIIGQDGVQIDGNLNISGQSVTISKIQLNNGKLNISNTARNITVENSYFADFETKVRQAENVRLNNNFFRGLIIENCKNTTVDHCTILTPAKGITQNAPLWIYGADIEVKNSIIYGEKLAVIFSDRGSRLQSAEYNSAFRTRKIRNKMLAKKRIFKHNLWYGEEGFCAINNDEVIGKEAQIRRYCRPRSNIYKPPQFRNPRNEDWILVKGVPGSGQAEGKKDCGVIWAKSIKINQLKKHQGE